MAPSADEPPSLTHIGPRGEARMVDVSDKEATSRLAVAEGRVRMAASTLTAILAGDAKKGDVTGADRRHHGGQEDRRAHSALPSIESEQGSGRYHARQGPARPHRAGRGALLGADRRRDGGADRRLRRLPHYLRHG